MTLRKLTVWPLAAPGLLVLGVMAIAAGAAAQPDPKSSPPATAEYTLGPGHLLRARLDARHEGPDAARVRSSADADHDGNVSADEARQLGERLTRANGALPAISLPTGAVRLDGATHNRTTLRAITISGAEGPAANGAPFVESWDLELGFPGTGDVHEVRLEPANASRAGHLRMRVGALTVVAPAGHRIAHAGGLPLFAAITPDGSRAVFPSGLGAGEVTLIVEPVPVAKPAASWPVAPVGGAVLWAAWARGRHRGSDAPLKSLDRTLSS